MYKQNEFLPFHSTDRRKSEILVTSVSNVDKMSGNTILTVIIEFITDRVLVVYVQLTNLCTYSIVSIIMFVRRGGLGYGTGDGPTHYLPVFTLEIKGLRWK